MKTWDLDAPVIASQRVQAVKPRQYTLEDEKPGLGPTLADYKALKEEVARLTEISLRAQKREVEAVNRCEALESALKMISNEGMWPENQIAHRALKGRPMKP